MSYTLTKRVQKALYQEAKKTDFNGDMQELYAILTKLLSMCGEASHARKIAYKIGLQLMRGHMRVIAPACPDYSHDCGVYTFRGLGSGVSLLTQKHVVFLNQLQEVVPSIQPILLVADLEYQDSELCKAVGVSVETFRDRVQGTLLATQAEARIHGWEAMNMTDLITDLERREEQAYDWINESADFAGRIDNDTLKRVPMYRKINPALSIEDMRKRTLRTAAQYVALGCFAAEENYMVCNHSTVNLSWYLQTDAAILHNAVSVY